MTKSRYFVIHSNMHNNNQRGKLIVLYGVNNLGKTTQAKMLVHKLITHGAKAEYIKYPIYNLAPSGVVLNNYLRGGNFFNLTAREAQIFYAANRTQFEKELIKKLESGVNIIAEDYTGTGLAWGIGKGVDELFLKYINSHLLKENLAFLFDGERFLHAQEKNHKHETDNDLINKARQIHLKLGKEKCWKKINANLPVEEIHEQLWNEVTNLIPLLTKEGQGEVSGQTEKILKTDKVIIERLTPTAKLPTRAHTNDAGLDLYSNENYTLFPGDTAKIKTGIKMQIPAEHVGLIWDKSGIATREIHTIGGVIDSSYRGEIIVLVKNLSNDIYNIARGQQVAQVLIQKVEAPKIVERKIEDETERGSSGFGSSGLF